MEWVVSRIARVFLASRMQPHSVRRDAGSRPVLGSSYKTRRRCVNDIQSESMLLQPFMVDWCKYALAVDRQLLRQAEWRADEKSKMPLGRLSSLRQNQILRAGGCQYGVGLEWHQIAAERVSDHGDGDAQATLHASREGPRHFIDHTEQIDLRSVQAIRSQELNKRSWQVSHTCFRAYTTASRSSAPWRFLRRP